MDCTVCLCILGSGKERADVVRREMNLEDAETRDGHARVGAAAGTPGQGRQGRLWRTLMNAPGAGRRRQSPGTVPLPNLCGEQRTLWAAACLIGSCSSIKFMQRTRAAAQARLAATNCSSQLSTFLPGLQTLDARRHLNVGPKVGTTTRQP